MTDEQKELIEEFIRLYADTAPNPDHFPKSFEYVWKTFLYNKRITDQSA